MATQEQFDRALDLAREAIKHDHWLIPRYIGGAWDGFYEDGASKHHPDCPACRIEGQIAELASEAAN